MAIRRFNYRVSLVLGGAIAAVAAIAWAQVPDDALVIEQPVNRDVYAANREINVQSTIDGDLVAASRRVTIDGNVTGDVMVAAQEIEIRSDVSDDVRAFGQQVRVMSPVADHMVAAGQTIIVNENVGGWAWLAGDTVEVLGDVGDDLNVRARKITIDSEVDGDVHVIGNELRLGPEAHVRGDVRWRSENEADIDPEATIDGEFIVEPASDSEEDSDGSGGPGFTLSVVAAVMALFALFPQPMRATADKIATRPFASLVLGFAVMVSMPVLAIILMFSPLKAIIGLALLGTYFVTLFFSVMAGLFAVSHLVLRRFRPQPAVWQALTAILVTVVAVGLLTNVPYLGNLVVMGIWLLGIGALSWGTWTALHDSGPDAPQNS